MDQGPATEVTHLKLKQPPVFSSAPSTKSVACETSYHSV